MQPSIAPRHALIIGLFTFAGRHGPLDSRTRVLIALLYVVAGAKQGIGLHLIKKLQAKGWTVHASVRSLTKDAESIAEVLPTSEVTFV
jgi:hypothetical protein